MENGSNQTDAGASPGPQESHSSWYPISGIDLATAKFPARATLNGEGIVVFKTRDGYRGTQRNCPHMQASLTLATLAANDSMVRCSLHIFTFRLSDGKGVNCPGFRIKVFEVRQEDSQLYGRAAPG